MAKRSTKASTTPLEQLSEAVLATLLTDVARELQLRAKLRTRDIAQVITGNEHVKRAIEVAAVARQTLLLTGPNGCGKSLLVRLACELDWGGVIEVRSCPCGSACDPFGVCNCTEDEIRAYRLAWPDCQMFVEATRPTSRELEARLSGRSVAEMRQAIEAGRTSLLSVIDLQANSLQVADVAYAVLKRATAELGLTAKQQADAVARAKAIAAMDFCTSIRVAHICESINYRMVSP